MKHKELLTKLIRIWYKKLKMKVNFTLTLIITEVLILLPLGYIKNVITYSKKNSRTIGCSINKTFNVDFALDKVSKSRFALYYCINRDFTPAIQEN